MDFSQTFSPPSPTTLSYNSMSLEPPSGWSSKKKNNGVSSYTLHTEGFLFLVPLVRQTRFSYLHHLLVHHHNVVTNIVTTAVQIHNWGWPPRQSQERQKEKKAKNEDSHPPNLLLALRDLFLQSSGQKEWDFYWSFGCPPAFENSVTQISGPPSYQVQRHKKKKRKGISLVLVVLPVLIAIVYLPESSGSCFVYSAQSFQLSSVGAID